MDADIARQDAVFHDRLATEFKTRGWILKFQPGQSPMSNVNETFFFPALSKRVVAEQELLNDESLVFNDEQLWTAVSNCYHKFPLDMLRDAYAGHHKMVNAIVHHKGRDDFIRGGAGVVGAGESLQANVRKCCTTVCDQEGKAIGVEVMTSIEEMDSTSLKYPVPKLDNVMLEQDLTGLTRQELAALISNLPAADSMYEKLHVAYAGQGESESAD